jgi:prepilin-type N-terminal cleavage/methylation domain-containing protein
MNCENGQMKKRHSSFIFHTSSFSHGFTLIEILLVVVIILIATGVSVPLFRGTFQSTQMNDAVRSTIRMARYARSLSILKQDECTLRFKDGLLTLSCGGTNAAEPETSRRLPGDIKISEFENLAEARKLPDEERFVRYYPTGMNDGFSVTFRDEKDRRVTVSCNPISGKTTVKGME